ncbi:anti-sigma factor [Alloalcanivorax marinus]|uniref:anti-sigma factor n=2 Tax=Alloalcanivorax marinus TaxID=1177169 RepID=UPI001958C324|nr:anti-sigma factor [Alloalcanivorax marinus]MBM7332590.1 anti-sigma factor [Alloalcanivorax marinus]
MIPDDPQERRLLIAEYVLGLHQGERAEEIERWLAWDAEAARLAARWRESWTGAAELLPEERLPPRLWRRVARQAGLATPWWRAGWASVSVWRTVSAALLVAVVLLAGPLRAPAPVYTVVLQAPGEAASPGWRVTVSADGDLQLTPLVTGQYAADRSVQFWTLENDAPGPRSLGLVEPGRTLVIPAHRVGGVESGQLFELTLEPQGGSPKDRPTGPVLFIGRAVEI